MAYIRTLLLAAALFALASALSPVSPSLRRAVGTALSLLFLTLLISPTGFSSLFSAVWQEPAPLPEGGGSLVEQTVEDAITKGIKTDLCRTFSLLPEKTGVEVQTETVNDRREVKRVTVVLSGENRLADLPGIRRYIEGTYGAKGEVITGGRE